MKKRGYYDPTPEQIELARIGSKLMDYANSVPVKGLSEKDLKRFERMCTFGDLITRFGMTFGPKTLNDVLSKSGTSYEEAEEFMKIGLEL